MGLSRAGFEVTGVDIILHEAAWRRQRQARIVGAIPGRFKNQRIPESRSVMSGKREQSLKLATGRDYVQPEYIRRYIEEHEPVRGYSQISVALNLDWQTVHEICNYLNHSKLITIKGMWLRTVANA